MNTIRPRTRATATHLISVIGAFLMTAAAIMPFAGMVLDSASRGLLL